MILGGSRRRHRSGSSPSPVAVVITPSSGIRRRSSRFAILASLLLLLINVFITGFIFRHKLGATDVQDFFLAPEVRADADEANASNARLNAAKRLRVVLVANQFRQQFPLIGYGGIEAAVETLAEELSGSGINFAVITPNVTVPPAVPYNFSILQTPSVAPCDPDVFMSDVKTIIKGLNPQPDVIWGQSDWSGRHLYDLGIPVIVTHHDSGDGKHIQLTSGRHILNRFISQGQLDSWSKHKRALRNGTDAFALWYGFSPKEFVLYRDKVPKTALFVGRLIAQKGIQEFIFLARWNPDWTFYCYGGERQGFQQSLPPNVKYMGELKRGEAHREVFGKASRFFMFVKWSEGFGRVVVEAMSKGTPVLASNRGSLTELIRGPDGSGEGVVGTISHDVAQLNASLHMEYDYEAVYQYSLENFKAKKEVEGLLLKSLELVERVKEVAANST